MNLKNFIYKDPIIKQVFLLTLIGSIGFILNLIINSYLLKVSESYSANINNQLSKKELGIFLHNKITKIESNVKDLVSHTDKRKTYFIKEEIDQNLNDIENILKVISQGGFVVIKLPVNFYQNDFINDTIYYHTSNAKSFNINTIDISPKIIEIRKICKNLSVLKINQFEKNSDNIHHELERLKKEVETYVQRAYENSNRIFYETQLEYQSIKRQKEESIGRLRKIKTIWILSISLATMIILSLIIRRILHIVQTKNLNQEKLMNSMKSIENILDTIPVGFIIFDRRMKVIKVNKQAVTLFGANHESALLNKSCKDIFINSDEDICPFHTNSNKPITNELKIRTILGESKSVIKNAASIELNGKKVVLETFIDITKRKEIEEQLKFAKESAEIATQEKSKFLASMSHEIRTPLNGIIGMASMLQNTKLNEKQKDFLEIIQISSNNLVSIISDILDFSKIEAGEILIDKHSFSIKTELINNIKALNLKAEEKGIELKHHCNENIPEYIIGDSLRIKQVLINLVSNAIKFTDMGYVKVLMDYFEESSRLKVSVVDTGIGISEDRQKNIFNAFSQSDGSITRKYGGTGLGLTISKELIELMGGEIGLKSEINKGATFWFEIPVEIGKKPEKENSKPTFEKNEFLEIKILVAEDNIINQKVASAIFQRLGYEIDIADNGVEAVKMYVENTYDLIFMDIQMPIMDGITATKEIIRIATSKKQSVYITAMTANALKEDKKTCLSAGMRHFISKPIRPEHIEEAIQHFIKEGSKIT